MEVQFGNDERFIENFLKLYCYTEERFDACDYYRLDKAFVEKCIEMFPDEMLFAQANLDGKAVSSHYVFPWTGYRPWDLLRNRSAVPEYECEQSDHVSCGAFMLRNKARNYLTGAARSKGVRWKCSKSDAPRNSLIIAGRRSVMKRFMRSWLNRSADQEKIFSLLTGKADTERGAADEHIDTELRNSE